MTSRAADPARQAALARQHGPVTDTALRELRERNNARLPAAVAQLGEKYLCHHPINRKEVSQ